MINLDLNCVMCEGFRIGPNASHWWGLYLAGKCEAFEPILLIHLLEGGAATYGVIHNKRNLKTPPTLRSVYLIVVQVSPPPSYHDIPGTVPAHQGVSRGPPPSYEEAVDPNGELLLAI